MLFICRCICMASHNVAVRKDVYDALRKEKRTHESFTQLFLRLLNQRGPMDDLEGAWPRREPSKDRREWRMIRGAARRDR
jgi:predicted CopG family antitoxin